MNVGDRLMNEVAYNRKREIHVFVAMSGGVDSSVAAALLVDAGYRVTGVLLELWADEMAANQSSTGEAVAGARDVARRLDIPFELLDCRARFKQEVVDDFVATYARGQTPNPCIRCNPTIKFGYLLTEALANHADFLATGHYARIRRTEAGAYQLLKGVDPVKDQSYMLQRLNQVQLARALFPLGELTKSDVRRIARERGLPIFDRPESQDLCFLPGGDYRGFLSRHMPSAMRPGPIADTRGNILGQHLGLAGYTIGQRRGLGIAAPEPLYVVRLDVAANTLVVGPAEALGRDTLTAGHTSYISGRPPASPTPVQAKIRYTTLPTPALLTPLPDSRAHVSFDHPLRDITPGQSVAFYQGELLLGGGIIE